MIARTETLPFVYSFNGVSYDLSARTHIMGILNVTPDSFSDGGRFLDAELAVRQGLAMADEGADVIDVGGESTRPGAEPVSLDEECQRVIPVIEQLAAKTSVPLSIDTYKSEVAVRALDAGASIVNDISGLHADARLADVVADHKASIVLMHIKGTPKTMQVDPEYDDLIGEIRSYLREGIARAESKGIRQVLVDPGIGFGKKLTHNLEIFRNLRALRSLGYPILVGPSRKSFIGMISDVPVDRRLEGTAAAVAASIMNGANVVRVHDVAEMKRVAEVVDAIVRAPAVER